MKFGWCLMMMMTTTIRAADTIHKRVCLILFSTNSLKFSNRNDGVHNLNKKSTKGLFSRARAPFNRVYICIKIHCVYLFFYDTGTDFFIIIFH